jgi:hypothetical protein
MLTHNYLPGAGQISFKMCIGRESNPGRPRGRRAFYHWTTDAGERLTEMMHEPLTVTQCNTRAGERGA